MIMLLLFISANVMKGVIHIVEPDILVFSAKTVMAFLRLAINSTDTPSASSGAHVKIQFGTIRSAMSSHSKKQLSSTEKGTVRSAQSSVLYRGNCSTDPGGANGIATKKADAASSNH
jgi:hypothetical protein